MDIIGGILMAVGGAMIVKAAAHAEVRLPVPLEAELVAAYPLDPALPADMAELLGQLD